MLYDVQEYRKYYPIWSDHLNRQINAFKGQNDSSNDQNYPFNGQNEPSNESNDHSNDKNDRLQ